MADEVRLELDGAVAEIILNRPERKNAVTGPLAEAATAAVAQAEADPTVRVILLRGEGGVFSSGLDLKEFNAEPRPEWLPRFQGLWRGLHERLFACDKAVVCAMESYAINAGSALALSADYLIAGDTAFLQDYLDAAHARSEGEEDYVGEWHVHPAIGAPPSRTDRRSLRRIAGSSRYAVTEPVLMIVEHLPPELRLRCYRFAGRCRRGKELPLLDPG